MFKYTMQVPLRYIPKSLSKRDALAQKKMLLKSRKLYAQHQYYTRKKIAYSHKTSSHIQNAKKMYNVDAIVPSQELSNKTGCTMSALQQIVKKGEGAYYSSGSRPNQTPHSWGYARLASALTSGKAAAVDFDILKDGCDHNKKAFKLAQLAHKKYKFGLPKTRKVTV